MARRKKGRVLDGVVLLDKPLHLSSNDALQRVRRLFGARKAGHTGSLDPLATGLLPICFGEATKLSGYLLSAPKQYRVSASVGAETETGDREGAFTATCDTPVPERAAFERVLDDFRGAQQQLPPMYSALKVDGKPLYAYARAGEVVERATRPIYVHELACLESTSDAFTLAVTVSGGTYVRTLVEDIARAFGGCAHVSALRRTGVGGLGSDLPMVTFETLTEQADNADNALLSWLHPIELLASDWPRVVLDSSQATAMAQGQRIDCPAIESGNAEQLLRIDVGKHGMMGFGFVDDQGRLAPKRLFSTASA